MTPLGVELDRPNVLVATGFGIEAEVDTDVMPCRMLSLAECRMPLPHDIAPKIQCPRGGA